MTRYASGNTLPVPSRAGPEQGSSKLADELTGPIRTCAGCGGKVLQSELLRFVAREGALAHSPKGAGRGAYTCRRLACFERAVERRSFNRILRQTVQIDPELTRLYT